MGGAPANFAFHAAQMGFSGHVVSAVGRDDLGNEITDELLHKGLYVEIQATDYPTGTVQVSLDAQGIPQYNICPNVAWDNIAFTDSLARLAAQTSAVCFGSLAQRSPVSRATIHRFLDAMPEGEGRWKVFDVNLRQNFYSREVLEPCLQKCNILKLNDEELPVLTRMFHCEALTAEIACRRLLEQFHLEILILTCGSKGSYVFTHDLTTSAETPCVDVADTVGAGDSFTAAFVASMLRGDSIADAHHRAVQVSAYVCTQNGAMPFLPEELR